MPRIEMRNIPIARCSRSEICGVRRLVLFSIAHKKSGRPWQLGISDLNSGYVSKKSRSTVQHLRSCRRRENSLEKLYRPVSLVLLKRSCES